MAVVLDRRRQVLETLQQQGTPSAVVAELLRLLDEEASIAAEEFTEAKSRRELETARTETAETIAALLPSLLADVDVWEAAQLAVIDAAPRKTSTRTEAELARLDARCRAADDAQTIAEAMYDVEQNGDSYAVKSLWDTARKRLRELAAQEQRAHRLNGDCFLLLNKLENRLGKQLRRQLPDVRRADVAEEARRRKQAVRAATIDAARVLALDGQVAHALLELSAPENTTTVIGPAWEKLERAKRGTHD